MADPTIARKETMNKDKNCEEEKSFEKKLKELWALKKELKMKWKNWSDKERELVFFGLLELVQQQSEYLILKEYATKKILKLKREQSPYTSDIPKHELH